jgi:hypothetical protein
MDIKELIAELKYIAAFTEGDFEVRFASQPNWPFEYSIDNAIEVDLEDSRTGEMKKVVYLVEGRQIGYLPEEVKDEIGW